MYCANNGNKFGSILFRFKHFTVEYLRFASTTTGLNSFGKFNVKLVREHYDSSTQKTDNFGNDSAGEFTIVLPPPNVTGNLHIGHALTVTIEDALCRFHRMLGEKVRWIPGFDHAGIATQTVVEKQLFRQYGKRKSDLSDSEFVQFCERWKEDRIRDITGQLNSLGCTLDWPDLFYTMDIKFSKAVGAAFCQLYSQGLIVREQRLIQTVDETEPTLKEQWFLHCDEMNRNLLGFLDSGQLVLDPDSVRGKFLEWLAFTEPWCLSRQLLWGHKIPAFLATQSNRWIVAETVEAALAQLSSSEKSCDQPLRQDPDVLDTWFSSALIPLIVAGWPDCQINGETLSLMETGHDIVGFWVARMLIVCKQLTGHYPFSNVLLHGLVRDSQNRKMSKSLGNVVDPLDVIDGRSPDEMVQRMRASNLPPEEMDAAEKDLRKRFPHGMAACGADALRFALLRHDLSSQDVRIDIALLADEGRRFCNKLWNMAKYVERVLEAVGTLETDKRDEKGRVIENEKERDENDRVIELGLIEIVKAYREHMDRNRPHLAFEAVRIFVLRDLCDIYLETTKQSLWHHGEDERCAQRLRKIALVLRQTVGVSLQLLRTFMPYVCTFLIDQLDLEESSRNETSQLLRESGPEQFD